MQLALFGYEDTAVAEELHPRPSSPQSATFAAIGVAVAVVFADLGADASVVGHEFPFPVGTTRILKYIVRFRFHPELHRHPPPIIGNFCFF